MTAKQLIKLLNKNAETFAMKGDLKKSFACLDVAATLTREGFSDMKGNLDV